VSSQYLISTRWMSRRVLLRSLGRCCLGLVALLVAGGAAEVLPVSLNCPLPLRRTHSPTLVCSFCVFAAMGVTSTKSGQLEVNLSLSGKRAGWEEPFGNNSTFSWVMVIFSSFFVFLGVIKAWRRTAAKILATQNLYLNSIRAFPLLLGQQGVQQGVGELKNHAALRICSS